MWKATVGTEMNLKTDNDDDWETDPDFINDVTEQEQRWGSQTIQGSGRHAGAIDMGKLRKETEEADALLKKKQQIEGPNAAYGYGGKFGIESDRMDSSALGHDYVPKLVKHVSQTDYSTGFGGKFGIQTDRVDKSAHNWDHKESVEKHSSQIDYSSGFGGKFGVQSDRQDRSALGWDHIERVQKHESQLDYSHGFGGKFGIQSDRQDQSALGWDHHERLHKHSSQMNKQRSSDNNGAPAHHPSAKELREKFEQQQQPKPVVPKQVIVVDKKLAAEKKNVIESSPPSIASNKNVVESSTPSIIASGDVVNIEQETALDKQQKGDVEEEEEEEKSKMINEIVLEETGLTAIALYDYQAAANDEISFDPDDIITHVEMIDEGWWRGLCRDHYGLFPANYVQLQQN